jgi:hypothetical protein
MASWLLSWGSATCVASALLIGMPPPAHAESDADRAGARAAAEAGLAAYNIGRYSDALDLLRRAESLVHAPTHLLYMARASDRIGRLVQAHELYLKISSEPLAKDASRAFINAQQAARQEVVAIEGRLPYLTINTDGALPSGSKIKLDQREIPSVLLGVPFPVDPGSHVVVAISASGQSGEPANVTLAEAKRESITIKLPSQTSASPTPVVSTPPQVASQTQLASPPTTAPSPAERDANTQPGKRLSPIVAYSAIGVGVVGAAIGTVFLIQRGSKQSDADSAFNDCKTRYCGPNDISRFTQLDKDAATAGNIAIVSYGVGAAALTAGLYLVLAGRPKQTATLQTPAFVPYVGLNQAAASFRF